MGVDAGGHRQPDPEGMLPDLIRPAVPAMQALAALMPELEQLTERLDGVGQVVEGIPGAKMLRRRAAQEDDG